MRMNGSAGSVDTGRLFTSGRLFTMAVTSAKKVVSMS